MYSLSSTPARLQVVVGGRAARQASLLSERGGVIYRQLLVSAPARRLFQTLWLSVSQSPAQDQSARLHVRFSTTVSHAVPLPLPLSLSLSTSGARAAAFAESCTQTAVPELCMHRANNQRLTTARLLPFYARGTLSACASRRGGGRLWTSFVPSPQNLCSIPDPPCSML